MSKVKKQMVSKPVSEMEINMMPKRASIEQASNGFIVRDHNGKQSVHESMDDAHAAVGKIMGETKKESFMNVKNKANAKLLKNC